MAENEDTESVKISKKLLAEIERRAERTKFDSKSHYIEFVLEEVLVQADPKDISHDHNHDDDADDKEIQNRLKSLGYLK